MFDRWIETSPFEPADKNGFSKGIIHRSRTCPAIVAWVFSSFDDRNNYHHLKIGSGSWMKVKKDEPKCPDCFSEIKE